MTTIEQMKEIFTVGAEFDGYYGNGQARGRDTVTKVSEKSCWIDDARKSWNTIKTHFEKGIYRIIEEEEEEKPSSPSSTSSETIPLPVSEPEFDDSKPVDHLGEIIYEKGNVQVVKNTHGKFCVTRTFKLSKLSTIFNTKEEAMEVASDHEEALTSSPSEDQEIATWIPSDVICDEFKSDLKKAGIKIEFGRYDENDSYREIFLKESDIKIFEEVRNQYDSSFSSSPPSPSPSKPSPTLSPEKVREMIKVASPIELEIVWIPRIMENQTEDERASMTTTENNGKGLNAFDAKTITAYFKKIKSGRHLSPKQVEIAKSKLTKYANQYSAMTT